MDTCIRGTSITICVVWLYVPYIGAKSSSGFQQEDVDEMIEMVERCTEVCSTAPRPCSPADNRCAALYEEDWYRSVSYHASFLNVWLSLIVFKQLWKYGLSLLDLWQLCNHMISSMSLRTTPTKYNLWLLRFWGCFQIRNGKRVKIQIFLEIYN